MAASPRGKRLHRQWRVFTANGEASPRGKRLHRQWRSLTARQKAAALPNIQYKFSYHGMSYIVLFYIDFSCNGGEQTKSDE